MRNICHLPKRDFLYKNSPTDYCMCYTYLFIPYVVNKNHKSFKNSLELLK